MKTSIKTLLIVLLLPGIVGCATYNAEYNFDKDAQFDEGLKAFVLEDFEGAVNWLEQANRGKRATYYYDTNVGRIQTGRAQPSNPNAKFFLAYLYQNGLGVEKDENKAKGFSDNAPNLTLDVQWLDESRFVVVLRSTTSQFYQSFQRRLSTASLKEDRESRGIFIYSKLLPETSEIEFTYGNSAIRKMSFADFEIFVKRQLSDHTISTYNLIQGTQIEYFSPSGEVALWYPGNQRAVVGKYYTKQSIEPSNVERNDVDVLICFTYQPNSYNPVTGTRGSEEECTSAYGYLSQVEGKRRGDVFSLSSGTLPHSFERGSPPKWPDGKNIIDEKAPHG